MQDFNKIYKRNITDPLDHKKFKDLIQESLNATQRQSLQSGFFLAIVPLVDHRVLLKLPRDNPSILRSHEMAR